MTVCGGHTGNNWGGIIIRKLHIKHIGKTLVKYKDTKPHFKKYKTMVNGHSENG